MPKSVLLPLAELRADKLFEDHYAIICKMVVSDFFPAKLIDLVWFNLVQAITRGVL